MKRKIVWALIALVCVASLGGLYWTFFGTHTITMSQQEIQDRINGKMPYEAKHGVVVKDVQLDLSDNKIGLTFEAGATKLGTEYSINASTRGDLYYDNVKGEFFFRPDRVKVNAIQANGASVGEKVGNFIDKWVDSKKINENKPELMAKSEEFAQGLVQSAAETVLARVPVYKTKNDFKGHVVRMLLKSVEVKDGTVIAHLSLWQFTKMVALYGVIFVLSIGFAIFMLRHPEFLLVMPFLE